MRESVIKWVLFLDDVIEPVLSCHPHVAQWCGECFYVKIWWSECVDVTSWESECFYTTCDLRLVEFTSYDNVRIAKILCLYQDWDVKVDIAAKFIFWGSNLISRERTSFLGNKWGQRATSAVWIARVWTVRSMCTSHDRSRHMLHGYQLKCPNEVHCILHFSMSEVGAQVDLSCVQFEAAGYKCRVLKTGHTSVIRCVEIWTYIYGPLNRRKDHLPSQICDCAPLSYMSWLCWHILEA